MASCTVIIGSPKLRSSWFCGANATLLPTTGRLLVPSYSAFGVIFLPSWVIDPFSRAEASTTGLNVEPGWKSVRRALLAQWSDRPVPPYIATIAPVLGSTEVAPACTEASMGRSLRSSLDSSSSSTAFCSAFCFFGSMLRVISQPPAWSSAAFMPVWRRSSWSAACFR